MGSKSSRPGGGGGGGAIRAGQNSTTEITSGGAFVNRAEERIRFMETRNASDFTELPPDTIDMNGVTFTNISNGSRRSLDSNGRRQYISEYQANRPNQNGEYPVFSVVVTDTRRRTGYRYEFNQSSTSGTRFW